MMNQITSSMKKMNRKAILHIKRNIASIDNAIPPARLCRFE